MSKERCKECNGKEECTRLDGLIKSMNANLYIILTYDGTSEVTRNKIKDRDNTVEYLNTNKRNHNCNL